MSRWKKENPGKSTLVMRSWLNTEKGITRKPTEDEIAQMLAEAEQDNFKGSVMPKSNENGERLMVYKLNKDIKYKGSRAY